MTALYRQVNKIPRRIAMYVLMLAGITILYNAFIVVLARAPAFSMLPYKMTVALIGVITLRAVDDFVLTEVNTYNLMKRNPVGYAIYIMAYAIIIAGALSGA